MSVSQNVKELSLFGLKGSSKMSMAQNVTEQKDIYNFDTQGQNVCGAKHLEAKCLLDPGTKCLLRKTSYNKKYIYIAHGRNI